MTMQCQGPNCTNVVEQIPGGHRARKYCSDRCRVEAYHFRQQQDEQQKAKASLENLLAEQEAREEEARARFRARYGDLLPGTMALLIDLSERSFHSDLVDLVAAAIVRERNWARQSAAAERTTLAEEIMETGEALGFPFVAIEGLDLLAGISNWSNTCEYGSLERLRLVREAVVIRKRAIERRARLARLSQS